MLVISSKEYRTVDGSIVTLEPTEHGWFVASNGQYYSDADLLELVSPLPVDFRIVEDK